jgi:hypothetical protein
MLGSSALLVPRFPEGGNAKSKASVLQGGRVALPLCCEHSAYKGQRSPDVHLVFVDVKEVASV